MTHETTRRLTARRSPLRLARLALALTACGGSDDELRHTTARSPPTTSQAALTKGGTITVWAWEPTLKQVVTDFQAKYPKVKVKLVNAGTGNDQYTALQNAISGRLRRPRRRAGRVLRAAAVRAGQVG